jgi:hypothetical protein
MRSSTRVVGAALGLVVILVAVALAASSAGAAGGEGPVTAGVGEPPVDFDFGVTPKLLPTGEAGMTRLKLELEEAEPDLDEGGIGIQTAKVDLDRSITLEPRGLPVCRRPVAEGDYELEGAVSGECERAVVGRVRARLFVAYPESMGVRFYQEGKIYRSGIRGDGMNLLVEVPALEGFGGILWMVAKVRPADEGRIGSEMTIDVPQVAQGSGVLIGLRLELGRTFGREGDRVGFVQARCHGGKLTASASTRLTDGSKGLTDSVRACANRPS